MIGFGADTTAPQEIPPPAGYIPVEQCELRVKSAAEAATALSTASGWKRLVGPGMLAGFILGWLVFK